MNKDFTIAFIGAGNMGEAMIRGLVASGVAPRRILAWDVDGGRLGQVAKAYRVRKLKGIAGAMAADAVVIAVKPQVLEGVLAKMAASGMLPLVISIAAGVPVDRLVTAFGKKSRVVRVMPNTPALIGQGVSAYFAVPGLKKADLKAAKAVVSALGPAYQVFDESLMDTVTGLSGSGPAYVFVLIEALADAGVKMGLSRDLALKLAAHTVAGAAAMVIETGEHPAALKDKVASPGGTTIAGLAALERKGFRAAAMAAVEAATLRSREMGKPGGK